MVEASLASASAGEYRKVNLLIASEVVSLGLANERYSPFSESIWLLTRLQAVQRIETLLNLRNQSEEGSFLRSGTALSTVSGKNYQFRLKFSNTDDGNQQIPQFLRIQSGTPVS
jgi:hypothetical protein